MLKVKGEACYSLLRCEGFASCSIRLYSVQLQCKAFIHASCAVVVSLIAWAYT